MLLQPDHTLLYIMSQSQTVHNALDILEELGKAEEYLSVEDLSQQLNIPVSTVYRLLQTLEAQGFIERFGRKKIGLGYNFLSLARNFYDRIYKELSVIAQPYMEDVKKISEETCILSIRSNLCSQCVKSVSSDYIIRFVAKHNRLLKLNVGASSRAILAFESEKLIKLVKETLETDEERKSLDENLQMICDVGYSVSCNEYDKSSVGIAVPVFDSHGRIYASLAIVGPDSRVTKDKWKSIIDVLQSSSKSISEKLGEL